MAFWTCHQTPNSAVNLLYGANARQMSSNATYEPHLRASTLGKGLSVELLDVHVAKECRKTAKANEEISRCIVIIEMLSHGR
jgi:hypothetical protein